jgi:hypothetical protein
MYPWHLSRFMQVRNRIGMGMLKHINLHHYQQRLPATSAQVKEPSSLAAAHPAALQHRGAAASVTHVTCPTYSPTTSPVTRCGLVGCRPYVRMLCSPLQLKLPSPHSPMAAHSAIYQP